MSSAPAGSNPPVDAGGEVLIKIKTLEPATYELHVDRRITVAELKAELEGIVQNAPATRQRIIFRGRGLQDERTLRDLGVENGDTFHLVVRPADVAAATGTNQGAGQAPPQPQSLQDRLNADTRRILEQISQAMNINMGLNLGNPQGGNAAGPGGRQQQHQQAQQQAPVPHLLTTLHRFLQRLGEGSYTPPNIPLMSNAFTGANPQADFEALSRAMTELLQDVELPSHLVTMREEARRDPAGPGQQEQQQTAQGQGQASSEIRTTGEGAGTAAAGEGDDASGNGAVEGAQRSGRRGENARPTRLDYTGATYGYRYLPLASASLAALLDRTEAHVSGRLVQQLRQGASSARVLAIDQPAAPEARTAAYRRLRQLGGQLHATAALLIDMSRGILATVAALEDSPRTLAANTAAALRTDGTDADLPPLVPRALARGRGAPAEMGFIGPAGPMGGWMDVFGAQFSMPMGAQGTEDEVNRAATAAEAGIGAPGARGQPPSGMAVGSVHIDLGDLPSMPGGIGGLLNNIISAVTGGAVMPVPEGAPRNAAPGGGPADAARRATPAADRRGGSDGSGAEARRPSDSALNLIMPALTSVSGSIAASVMQILGGRTVNAGMLLQVLSRALSEHLRHVLDVLTARWDRLQRAAARRQRAARAQQQQRQATGEQAPDPAVGSQPAVATSGRYEDATAVAASDTLEEFRHVAPLINQLFPSWDSVLQVPPEAGDGENGEGNDSDEEGSSSGSVGDEAEGTGQEAADTADGRQQTQTQEDGQQRRSRRRQGARDGNAAVDRNAALNDEMSTMLRMLMPPMADSIGRSVAQSVYAALMSRTDPLDGQQLAMAVLQTLVSRLDVVADMVLANWSRIASGLEQIETASEGGSAMEVMSRMVDLASTIMSGAPPPGAPPVPWAATGRPPGAHTPATLQRPWAPPPQAPIPNTAAETDSTPAQAPPTAHPAAPQADVAAAIPTAASSAPLDAHPSPSDGLEAAQDKRKVEPAAAPTVATVPEVPVNALQQSASPAATGGEGAVPTISGTDASGAGAETPAAPAAAPSAAPKGLGLGLRPKKKPNNVATGSAVGAGPTASTATRGLAEGSDKESRTGTGFDTTSQGTEPRASAAASSSSTAGLQAVLRQALGTTRRSTARSTGAGTDRTGSESGAVAADPLDGLLEMMEHVMGTLDPRETGGDGGPVRASGGSGRADSDATASGGGGAPGGGAGLGGLLQMAQSIVSDPSMQPMIGNMMNMVLGGGGGANRGDASGTGLGGLLGSLLGGLPPAPSASSGSRRQGSSGTAEQVGYEVLAEVLGTEAGSHWREVIERDVEEMQQHVQVAAEEHSANYEQGVPSRRGGLLTALVGAERSGADEGDEEEDEYDVEDAEEGEAEEDNGR